MNLNDLSTDDLQAAYSAICGRLADLKGNRRAPYKTSLQRVADALWDMIQQRQREELEVGERETG